MSTALDRALPITVIAGQDLDFYEACMQALRIDPMACPCNKGNSLMPVFVSKKQRMRIGAEVELHTPWRRWFAWYPVTDFGTTYWLCRVEWRYVAADGIATTHAFHVPPRIEYRLAK